MDSLVTIMRNQNRVKHLPCTLNDIGNAMSHGGPPHESRQFTAADVEAANVGILANVVWCFLSLFYGSPLERLSLGGMGKIAMFQTALRDVAGDWRESEQKLSALKELGLRVFNAFFSSQLLFDILDLENLCRLILFRCPNTQVFLADIGQSAEPQHFSLEHLAVLDPHTVEEDAHPDTWNGLYKLMSPSRLRSLHRVWPDFWEIRPEWCLLSVNKAASLIYLSLLRYLSSMAGRHARLAVEGKGSILRPSSFGCRSYRLFSGRCGQFRRGPNKGFPKLHGRPNRKAHS